jgi:MFS family permease
MTPPAVTATLLPEESGAEHRRALAWLSVALVLGMSTWFSASAVVPQLEALWDLSATAKAWLTIAVQLGFVTGAVVSATLNLADVLAPRSIILIGAAAAGLANLGLLAAGGAITAIALRFATGFCIAGVYPPAFKLMATYFRHRRGMALGALGAAITLGNAMPHLVNWLGGVDWRSVIVVTSLLSALGGAAAARVALGPYPFPRTVFDPRQIGRVFANRGVRLATVGYVGHMWELFAMYAWYLVFFADHLANVGAAPVSTAALATFVVIASGAAGSLAAGRLADRWGRTLTTSIVLATSGACALMIGLTHGRSTTLLLLIALVWGATIVADSAQFSAMVTELADQAYVGTALTMQLALGFAMTMVTIWLVPIVAEVVTWRWAFAMLAIGPLVGIAAMARLRSLPEASAMAGGRR